MRTLEDFVRESNRIEGILRGPTKEEIHAHAVFCEKEQLEVQDVVNLVKVLQPDARLRDNISVPGVRVGNHIAPPSAPEIRSNLETLLERAYMNWDGSMHGYKPQDNWQWEIHCDYETLHPFTDGNGRSGRAIWLWCMGGRAPLGFLHQFYYQTLSAYR